MRSREGMTPFPTTGPEGIVLATTNSVAVSTCGLWRWERLTHHTISRRKIGICRESLVIPNRHLLPSVRSKVNDDFPPLSHGHIQIFRNDWSLEKSSIRGNDRERELLSSSSGELQVQ